MGRTKRGHAPVAASVRFTVRMEDLNEQGAGVAWHDGRKIVLEKTLPGELVEVEYHPGRPRKSRVSVRQLLERAPERQDPECPYFQNCGGCHLQHLAYPLQLEFKRRRIESLLRGDRLLDGIPVQPVISMEDPFHYRNKTQLPYRTLNGSVVFGLFRARTHELVEIDHCMVESREANRALHLVREWAERFHVPTYDERTHRGVLRHVLVRRSTFTGQLMVVLVCTTPEMPYRDPLQTALLAGLPSLHSLYFNVNRDRTNVILGAESILAWGAPYIEEQVATCLYRIFPHTLFRANTVQLIHILEKLRDMGCWKRTDRVLDLYCGVGLLSLSIAPLVGSVTGVEAALPTVLAARENAQRNQVSNAEFIAADAADYLSREEGNAPDADIMIVDPPRKGLGERTIEKMTARNPRHIIYLSSNPESFVGDLAVFAKMGYRPGEIQPFDLFPQTHHVECLARLDRNRSGPPVTP